MIFMVGRLVKHEKRNKITEQKAIEHISFPYTKILQVMHWVST